MMEKIYQNFNDTNIRSYVVYGKTADHKLYIDNACKTEAVKAEVIDAFEKGMLIIVEGSNKLVPVAMTATKFVTVSVSASTVSGTEWAIPTK